ncbi:hypothetical protein [Streptomyces sp. S.PB5]|uniref:hypothetical protein n=1 Tax=Streptomyces sp. S.PB5 TaxID=3020844 RepID=UPI0025B15659|nr:hypothetical protein [Streptomyces sp. S.PB5]MDN3025849.1 hypothetical protein [Streptomyces sp. S.PB5]
MDSVELNRSAGPAMRGAAEESSNGLADDGPVSLLVDRRDVPLDLMTPEDELAVQRLVPAGGPASYGFSSAL